MPGKRYKRVETFEDILERCATDIETKCIEWKGHVSKDNGYGYVYRDGNSKRVHKLAYELVNKKIIPIGIFICHKCDNRSCCNPDHLFEGTPKDNTLDMINKKRNQRGESHHSSKLSLEDCYKIKRFYKTGDYTTRQLAKMFGVVQRTVCLVLKDKHWRLRKDD